MVISIMNLPVEVLLDIIRNTRPRSVLCNLALCSRRMYNLVVPFLYQHVELFSLNIRKTALVLKDLACLFLRRPDLAQHVRRFTLRDNDFWGIPDKKFNIDKIDEILKIAIKASSHSKEEEEQWLIDVDRGEADAITTLFLPAFVKLEKLDLLLSDNQKYFDRMLERVLRKEKPFDQKPAFQHLRDVMHTHDNDTYGLLPKYLSLFTFLPAIRAVFGYCLESSTEDDNLQIHDTLRSLCTPSSLSHLELRDCRLNTENLTLLLQAPKALKTFIYDISVPAFSFCEVESHKIRNAITPQENFLENLWLEYEDMSAGEIMIPMRSFSSFKCLQILRIEANFLVGNFDNITPEDNSFSQNSRCDLIDIFPRTLQTLQIMRCNDQVIRALEELILQKSAQVPNLVELVLSGSLLELDNLRDKFARLADVSQSKGVSLCYKGKVEYDSAAEKVEKLWGINESFSWAEVTNGWNTSFPP